MNIETLKNNWKMITAVIGFLATLIPALITIDNRYSHKETFEKHEKTASERYIQLNEKTDQILQVMTTQLSTRKTILELKLQQNTITPEERVELNSLRDILN